MGWCGQCLLISDGSLISVIGSLGIVGIRCSAQQLSLQLFLIADMQTIPFQPGRQTAPNIWEKQYDGFNTRRHHSARLVGSFCAPVVELQEAVPVPQGKTISKRQLRLMAYLASPYMLNSFCLLLHLKAHALQTKRRTEHVIVINKRNSNK